METIIGIYDWERRVRQRLLIDLDMAHDNRVPAASESIEDALDYEAISKRIDQFLQENHFLLIETLAEELAELLLQVFSISWLRLTVAKPGAVAAATEVGVIIERGDRFDG